MPRETAESEKPPSEIQDSYEEENHLSCCGSPRICIEIPPLSESFDRTAYKVTSSQLTNTAQLIQNSSHAEASIYAPAPPPRPIRRSRTQRPFIWDEDTSVPDSQELNSSPYQLLVTQPSQLGESAGTTTGASIGEETQLQLSLDRSVSGETSSVHSSPGQLFENSSYYPQPDNISESNSCRTRDVSLSDQGTESSKKQFQKDSLEPTADVSAETAGSHLDLVISEVSSPISVFVSSQPCPTSSAPVSTSLEGLVATESSSQPRQPAQAESCEDSELQFQTQVPLIEDYDSGDESYPIVDDSER